MAKKAVRAETQLFRLTQILSNPSSPSGIVTKDDIVTKLGIQESSVPVYIHSLKKKYGAKIENVVEGRSVVGYLLKNNIDVPQFKRSAVPATVKKSPTVVSDDASIPVLDPEHDTYSDRDQADLHDMLGINTNGDY